MAYIFVSEDAEEWKNRSLTETSVELENVSDFLKCTLPSSPTRTLLSITTPDKILSSDSSSLVGESLPAYLDVLPRSHDNSDSYQAPPVPPRKSISASPRRKTSYVTCRHTHTHRYTDTHEEPRTWLLWQAYFPVTANKDLLFLVAHICCQSYYV